MKALSVKQPFAGLIAVGEKIIEVRSRTFPYAMLDRDILICSSLTRCKMDTVNPSVGKCEFLTHPIIILTGKAICVVRFRDCHIYKPLIDDLSACLNPAYAIELMLEKNQYAWDIDPLSVRIVKPFAVKGRLGFFDVDDDLIEVIE